MLFSGRYLSDLTFIEQGSPDFLPVDEGANGKSKDTALSQLINFGKRRLSAKTIVEIQQNQVQPYNLTVDAKIRVLPLWVSVSVLVSVPVCGKMCRCSVYVFACLFVCLSECVPLVVYGPVHCILMVAVVERHVETIANDTPSSVIDFP